MVETLLVILSMIGAIAVVIMIIAGAWYFMIQQFKKEEEKDIYEVVYITKEQLALMNENQMIELVIDNKKIIIKLY